MNTQITTMTNVCKIYVWGKNLNILAFGEQQHHYTATFSAP